MLFRFPLEHAGQHCPRRMMRVKCRRFFATAILCRPRTTSACRTISTDSERSEPNSAAILRYTTNSSRSCCTRERFWTV